MSITVSQSSRLLVLSNQQHKTHIQFITIERTTKNRKHSHLWNFCLKFGYSIIKMIVNWLLVCLILETWKNCFSSSTTITIHLNISFQSKCSKMYSIDNYALYVLHCLSALNVMSCWPCSIQMNSDSLVSAYLNQSHRISLTWPVLKIYTVHNFHTNLYE